MKLKRNEAFVVIS